MLDHAIPSEGQIYAWIESVFAQGIRRPGYPADRWAEQFCLDQFRSFGLENVRLEPVELPRWEPRAWSLSVWPEGDRDEAIDVPCFPLPHTSPCEEFEADLVAFDGADPEKVRGAVALYDERLTTPRHNALAGLATWAFDPDSSFAESRHVLPFGPDVQHVMEPAMAGGAAGFVGA